MAWLSALRVAAREILANSLFLILVTVLEKGISLVLWTVGTICSAVRIWIWERGCAWRHYQLYIFITSQPVKISFMVLTLASVNSMVLLRIWLNLRAKRVCNGIKSSMHTNPWGLVVEWLWWFWLLMKLMMKLEFGFTVGNMHTKKCTEDWWNANFKPQQNHGNDRFERCHPNVIEKRHAILILVGVIRDQVDHLLLSM